MGARLASTQKGLQVTQLHLRQLGTPETTRGVIEKYHRYTALPRYTFPFIIYILLLRWQTCRYSFSLYLSTKDSYLFSNWFYTLYISCAVIHISSYTNGRLILYRWSRVYLCRFHSGDSIWPGKFELWIQLHFHGCTEYRTFHAQNARPKESTSSNTFTQTIADYLNSLIFHPMASLSRPDDPSSIPGPGSVNNLSITDYSTPNVLTQPLNLDSNSSQQQITHTSNLSVGSEPTLG